MSLKYNFAFKDSELQKWVTRSAKENKKTLSLKEKIELIKKSLQKGGRKRK